MNVLQMLLGTVLISAVFSLVLSGFAWPVYGLVRWTGIWRMLASVPLGVLAVKAGTVAADIYRDPTSHNLFPFEMALFVLPVPVYMLVLTVARRSTAASKA